MWMTGILKGPVITVKVHDFIELQLKILQSFKRTEMVLVNLIMRQRFGFWMAMIMQLIVVIHTVETKSNL